MENRWLRLAAVSFAGIIVSALALFIVQSMAGVVNPSATHQTHGGAGQVMVTNPAVPDHSGGNHGQNLYPAGYQNPGQYPNPYMNGYYQPWNPYMSYDHANHYGAMQYQMNMMKQQIMQMKEQLNNMNNMSGGMGGMSMM